MKDTIIPAAFVVGAFALIFIIAGVWVYSSGQKNNNMDDSQKAEELGMTDLSLGGNAGTGEFTEITPGLKVQDVVVGEGEEVKAGQTVAVKYVGQLENGTIFDASDNHPDENGGFTFPLGGGMVIKGWDLGVVGMKPGGVRMLTISPELGYGDRDLGAIPPNSTLLFKVELIGVVN